MDPRVDRLRLGGSHLGALILLCQVTAEGGPICRLLTPTFGSWAGMVEQLVLAVVSLFT